MKKILSIRELGYISYELKMNNISSVSEAYMCSSCGACKAICPKDCISFNFSSIGRMFAVVDGKNCIDCGLCTKVCPSLDKIGLHNRFEDQYIGNLKKVYVGRCKDEAYFKNAQSKFCPMLHKTPRKYKKVLPSVFCLSRTKLPILKKYKEKFARYFAKSFGNTL